MSSTGSLLAIVVPTAYDDRVGQLPGLDGAATSVLAVSAGDNSLIDAIETICRLHDINDPKELCDQLTQAVGSGVEQEQWQFPGYRMDGHELVRDYATQAIIARYGRADPRLAMELLKARIESVRTARDLEEGRIITAISNLLDSDDYPAGTNEAALTTLFDLLYEPGQPETAGRNYDILHCLRYGLSRSHIDAEQLYDPRYPESRRRLNKILIEIAAEASGHSDDAAEAVRELQAWLNKPPAVATQPAATQPATPGR
jgi:hypothetical protein